ncbi:MAG: hypothetical protein LBC86_06730 [Oscillospiraceae bacterium]|nr:hypothetical protein [Oscillospiraceae bacterium]
MNREALCVATFCEVIRPNMNKKSAFKYYDDDKKLFTTELGVITKDGSGVLNFYTLLFESLTYNPQFTADDIPDIAAPRITQIKKRNEKVPDAFISIAQLPGIANSVSCFFAANLTPNINKKSLNIVVDAVDSLVQNDTSLGKKNLKLFKTYKQNKTPEDYLAEVWVLAVTRNNESMKSKVPVKTRVSGASIKSEEPIYEHLPVVLTPPVEIKDIEIPYVVKLM